MNKADVYRSWRSGNLVPGRIALARAYMALPQQSIANVCGTDAETVDLWEQGVEYPSLSELLDLLAFTRQPIEFFLKPVAGLGALFAVPRCWDGSPHEVEALTGEFCILGVQAAVWGWPVEGEALVEGTFA